MPEFVTFDAYVRGRSTPSRARDAAADIVPMPSAAAAAPASAPASSTVTASAPCSCERLTHELSLARLAALEAFDRARATLLEAFARDVLARELALEPCDVERLARDALLAFAQAEPVALVVAPGAASRLRLELPVREDPALGPHDLVLEIRDGAVDLRLAIRVTDSVAAVREATRVDA